MHINLQQTYDKYSEAERLHVQECEQCQEDIKLLEQLKASANVMPVIIPEASNWQAIRRHTIDKKSVAIPRKIKRARPYFFQQFIGIAASTFFIAVGWLVWSNYQLQSQLEQVLMVNQSLELQLFDNATPTFHQAGVLNKVRNIELKLSQSTNAEEKLILLNKRKLLIQEIVNIQKENNDAISI